MYNGDRIIELEFLRKNIIHFPFAKSNSTILSRMLVKTVTKAKKANHRIEMVHDPPHRAAMEAQVV